jgi:hypothetical protein
MKMYRPLSYSVINGDLTYPGEPIISRSSFVLNEDKVSIIFRYFEVLKLLFSIVDKLDIKNTYIQIPLKIAFISLVFILNYILIIHKSFLKVIMFIIMINYTRFVFKQPNIDNLTKCIKRWYYSLI